MVLNDVAMIAADTSRSRVYLQSLIRNDLMPNFVFLLANEDDILLPGQVNGNEVKNKDSVLHINHDSRTEVKNNLSEPVKETLEKTSIEFEQLRTKNIHDKDVIKRIQSRSESVFIYSGYGGVILRKSLFLTKKRFLHVHGGYLPNYKGSTTNYYSLINENIIGASSIFLNEDIDSGPLLMRKKFKPPKDRKQIDHVYDSEARAKVLIETLKTYVQSGLFQTTENLEAGETYFIIHPVLKHIAILARN